MTNYEKIISMSKEKFADKVTSIGIFSCEGDCSEHDPMGKYFNDDKCDMQCTKHCLEWLNQEVKE